MTKTSGFTTISTKLEQIAKLAKEILRRRVLDGVSPTSSEAVTRRAGCGSPARPDLWGAGDWNLPGLPDPLSVGVHGV
jgi:hypothetical protein